MDVIQTTILSTANPLVKDVRRAVARGGLTDDGYWVAEGFHLLDEALRSGLNVPVVLGAESAAERLAGVNNMRLVSDSVFQTLAATETTQGVVALVEPPRWSRQDLSRGQSLLVVLDGVQDPGNAGAVVRAAEAFGASGVLFTRGTVSPFHPKTLRGSAGSLFRVPFLRDQILRDQLEAGFMHVFAAMPFTEKTLTAGEADFRQPCAIVIGSEGRGVSPEILQFAEPVAIRTAGVESLNAAVAAAILLYEAHRQRT